MGARRQVKGRGDRAAELAALDEALRSAGSLPVDGRQGDKKNFGERLSRALAQVIADALRRRGFDEVLPTSTGQRHESLARGERGPKKLDVNYSTPEEGLALGVSIKTINARDRDSQRYTKNFSRVDNELRAEATDYHRRQPYAVLVAVIFLPYEACFDDGPNSSSSFAAAVEYFRLRNHRRSPRQDPDFFEECYVALYAAPTGEAGRSLFFDVNHDAPREGPPSSPPAIEFPEYLDRVVEAYRRRNAPRHPFEEESSR